VGQLLNPDATSNCEYSRYAEGDSYLASLNMYWSQRWRNFGIFLSYASRVVRLILRYVIFNFFAIFFLFYITRIRKLEKKKSTKKPQWSTAKEAALRVGKNLEDVLIRKNDGEGDKQGVDHAMNSSSFAIFQGAGLETFDSRGLGRQWTRKDEHVD
jgi:hypothetical protein